MSKTSQRQLILQSQWWSVVVSCFHNISIQPWQKQLPGTCYTWTLIQKNTWNTSVGDKLIEILSCNLNLLQHGKVNTKQNVLNLGAVNCAGRCPKWKDQRDDKFRASSICGRTVPAIQTGLIRRGASNDGPAVPSHMGATQSLHTRSRIDEARVTLVFFLCIPLHISCSHFSLLGEREV